MFAIYLWPEKSRATVHSNKTNRKKQTNKAKTNRRRKKTKQVRREQRNITVAQLNTKHGGGDLLRARHAMMRGIRDMIPFTRMTTSKETATSFVTSCFCGWLHNKACVKENTQGQCVGLKSYQERRAESRGLKIYSGLNFKRLKQSREP